MKFFRLKRESWQKGLSGGIKVCLSLALLLLFAGWLTAWPVVIVFGLAGLFFLVKAARSGFKADRFNTGLIWSASIGVNWPLLQNRLPITHDLDRWHLFFVNELDRLIRQGNFYPRWADDFNSGHGSSLFNFFPPLGRYLPEIFHLLGFSFTASFNLVLWLAALGSGLAFYHFARITYSTREFARPGALLGSLAYLYFPYRVSETYQRGDTGELLFFIIMPLFLLGVYQLLAEGPTLPRFLGTTGAAALALMTHHLQIVLLLFLGGGWIIALLFSERFTGNFKELSRRAGMLAGAVLFGLGIAAFFWVPALAQKDLILVSYLNQQVDRDFAFSPQNLRLFPPITPESYNTNWIGLNQIGLALVCGYAFLWQARKKFSQNRRLVLQAFYFCAALLFILFTQSAAFYETFNALNRFVPVQFPSRLLVFGALASAWLVGLLPGILKPRWRWAFTGAALAWLAAGALANLAVYQYPPEFEGTIPPAELSFDAGRALVSHSPASLVPLLEEIEGQNLPGTPEKEAALSRVLAAEKGGSPAATTYRVEAGLNQFKVEVTLTRESTLALPPFYYPGWRVWLVENGVERELQTYATGRLSLVGVMLPAGNYRLIARYETSGPATFSSWLSFIGALAFLVLGGFVLLRRAGPTPGP